MFSLLYSKTPHSLSCLLRNFCDLRVLECGPVIITRSLSSTISSRKQLKEPSFTVSYLINSCGLSPEDANVVSKRVKFETLDRPDSVLALFNKYGFQDSQIAKIVKTRPKVLLADPKKTIASKLEFFSSVGITGANLAKLISSSPELLQTSLNRIIPLYKLLKSTLLPDDLIIIKAIGNASRHLVWEEARAKANIACLREVGMPQSVIQLLVIHHFKLLRFKVDFFRHKTNEVIDMGFRPTESKFILALAAVSGLSESAWQHKIEVYGRCGLSKDEVMSAFKLHPQFMSYSEKKIIDTMDFLVNVIDMKPSAIAACPYLCSYSLKKRIIPRGLVVKLLMSKGVLENDINFYSVLNKRDEWFSKEYVEKHREQIPCLVDVFKGRVSPQELGFKYGCASNSQ